MRTWSRLQHEFWRSVSAPGYVTFMLAVASTFGTMGFLLDLVNIDAPFSNALYTAVFSALVAIGWFVSMTRDSPSSDRPLADIASQLLERVREFGPQLDDQTLLLIRIR